MPQAEQGKDGVLVTILLKHQQDKNLPEISIFSKARVIGMYFTGLRTRGWFPGRWPWAWAISSRCRCPLPTPPESGTGKRSLGSIQHRSLSYTDYQNVWETYIRQRRKPKKTETAEAGNQIFA
jgi:hypothetical protein